MLANCFRCLVSTRLAGYESGADAGVSRLMEVQEAFILKPGAEGMSVAEICRKAGITNRQASFQWLQACQLGAGPSGRVVCSPAFRKAAIRPRVTGSEIPCRNQNPFGSVPSTGA